MNTEYNNTNICSFVSRELTFYPELPQYTAEELQARMSESEFWEEMSEVLDCLRICSECGKPMIEGYCIDDGREHYCSNICLSEKYTEQDVENLHAEDIIYYTVWYEDSISYNK